MDWKECLKKKVRRKRPNAEEARSLLNVAEKRMSFISSAGNRRKFPSLIVEGYYEVIKELVTALMSLRGFKSYSHECLTGFLREFHSEFSAEELVLIDQMRKIRNDINYRGAFLEYSYLEMNEDAITGIISKAGYKVKKELGP